MKGIPGNRHVFSDSYNLGMDHGFPTQHHKQSLEVYHDIPLHGYFNRTHGYFNRTHDDNLVHLGIFRGTPPHSWTKPNQNESLESGAIHCGLGPQTPMPMRQLTGLYMQERHQRIHHQSFLLSTVSHSQQLHKLYMSVMSRASGINWLSAPIHSGSYGNHGPFGSPVFLWFNW